MPRGTPIVQSTPQRRIPTAAPGKGYTMLPGHDAVIEGRTLFPSTVVDAGAALTVLKSGFNQRKVGKRVTKGRWRGMEIYCLTLEERKTCPRSCQHWLSCYGNNMHRAQRIEAGPELERLLWLELAALEARHPAGFVVRLHILGDFYSTGYVRFWKRALAAFPALRVFGYTARHPRTDPIGRALWQLTVWTWDRFAIRFSGREAPTMGAVTIKRGGASTHVICPAQTAERRGDKGDRVCATCTFCWESQRTIAFENHSGLPGTRKSV